MISSRVEARLGLQKRPRHLGNLEGDAANHAFAADGNVHNRRDPHQALE